MSTTNRQLMKPTSQKEATMKTKKGTTEQIMLLEKWRPNTRPKETILIHDGCLLGHGAYGSTKIEKLVSLQGLLGFSP